MILMVFCIFVIVEQKLLIGELDGMGKPSWVYTERDFFLHTL